MFTLLNITRALSDENRLRILMALRTVPLCVCQITAFLDLAPSTTSKHLSILRQARLIESVKQGRWVYYQLADTATLPMVKDALAWLLPALQDDPRICKDAEHIAAIVQAAAKNGLDASDPEHLFCHSPELHLLDQTVASEQDKGAPHA